MLEAARSLGIPTFDDQNGEMMEAEGGAAITNVRIRDGRRLSVFRSYTYPYMDRHNLTVLTGTLVARIVFHGRRAAEVEFLRKLGRKDHEAAGGLFHLSSNHRPMVTSHRGEQRGVAVARRSQARPLD